MSQAFLLVIIVANFLMFHPQSGHEVYQFTSSAWYYGTFYTKPPSGDATRVYFQGEPVGAQVKLYNEGGANATIRKTGEAMSQNFQMEFIEAPKNFNKQLTRYDFAPAFQKIPVTGEIKSQPLSPALTIAPKESIMAQVTIRTSNGEPFAEGIYRFRITSLLKIESQNAKVNNDDFVFEIRSVKTPDDNIEMLRRNMLAAISSNQKPEVIREKIQALLRIYPNSSMAYSSLGQLEYKSGNLKAAISAIESAITLLRSNQDTIALKYASRNALDGIFGTLAATANAWRRQLK
jgi:tetratricopeptide (TPR) repeat protein